MSTMRVTIVLEFHDVEPGSERDESIIDTLTSACESIESRFDADGCWVDDAQFIDATLES